MVAWLVPGKSSATVLGQDPVKILSPYVLEGMTVVEPGPGMGFFTLPLAQIDGPTGRVIAIDVQPKMIANLKRRAAKANLLERIDARVTLAEPTGPADLKNTVDLTLAFAVVHEFRNAARFFREAENASRPGAQLLPTEPSGHVNDENLAELGSAAAAGFTINDRPSIPRSKAALLAER